MLTEPHGAGKVFLSDEKVQKADSCPAREDAGIFQAGGQALPAVGGARSGRPNAAHGQGVSGAPTDRPRDGAAACDSVTRSPRAPLRLRLSAEKKLRAPLPTPITASRFRFTRGNDTGGEGEEGKVGITPTP